MSSTSIGRPVGLIKSPVPSRPGRTAGRVAAEDGMPELGAALLLRAADLGKQDAGVTVQEEAVWPRQPSLCLVVF